MESPKNVKVELREAVRQMNLQMAFSCEPVRTLSELLALKEDKKLAALHTVLCSAEPTELSREELLSADYEALCRENTLESILTGLNENEYRFFIAAAEEDKLCDPSDELPIHAPLAFGLCAPFLQDDKILVVVPEEIKMRWEKLREGDFPQRKEQIELINRYAVASVNLYGAIRVKALARIIKRFEDISFDDDAVRSAIIAHIIRESPCYLWEDYIVSPIFEEEPDTLSELIDASENIPRYVPETKEAFLAHMSESFTEPAPEYQKMLDFLTEITGDSYVASMITGDLCALLTGDVTDEDCLMMLMTCGLEFEDFALRQRLLMLLRGMRKRARLWKLRGHTESERKAMVMPQRNDKCPCGSGSKYKICCLGK